MTMMIRVLLLLLLVLVLLLLFLYPISIYFALQTGSCGVKKYPIGLFYKVF